MCAHPNDESIKLQTTPTVDRVGKDHSGMIDRRMEKNCRHFKRECIPYGSVNLSPLARLPSLLTGLEFRRVGEEYNREANEDHRLRQLQRA